MWQNKKPCHSVLSHTNDLKWATMGATEQFFGNLIGGCPGRAFSSFQMTRTVNSAHKLEDKCCSLRF